MWSIFISKLLNQFFFTLAATIGNFAYITLAKQGPFSYCNFLFNILVSWKHLKHQTAIILYQQKKYYSFSYTGGRVQYQGGGDCLILLKMQSYLWLLLEWHTMIYVSGLTCTPHLFSKFIIDRLQIFTMATPRCVKLD